MLSRRQQSLAAGLLKRIGNHQVGAKHQGPDLLKLLEFSAVMVGSQATAPQAHAVQTPHPARMAFHQTIRRNIPVDAGHASHHGHPTNVNELVNAETATDHCTVFDHYVARHLNGIGHHDVVAQVAVVTQMPDLPKGLFVFAGIDGVRFRRPVVPGDQLVIRCELLSLKRKRFGKVKAEATVDGDLACSGELMFSLVD